MESINFVVFKHNMCSFWCSTTSKINDIVLIGHFLYKETVYTTSFYLFLIVCQQSYSNSIYLQSPSFSIFPRKKYSEHHKEGAVRMYRNSIAGRWLRMLLFIQTKYDTTAFLFHIRKRTRFISLKKTFHKDFRNKNTKEKIINHWQLNL